MVLTQTHPAATYVCKTGNITLRCQYDGVADVFGVVWRIGFQAATDPSNIPGHTAFPLTSTYQAVVVDTYTSLAPRYTCQPTFSNGSRLLESNQYNPENECEFYQTSSDFRCGHLPTCLASNMLP